MKKIFCAFLFIGFLSACDLQPRIASIPDDVGDFISSRYPTLLAEPDSEIYKTAVADYGMYASASEYGNGDITDADYVLYSPADDYMMPAQDTDVDARDVGMPADDVTDNAVAENAPAQGRDEYGFAPDDNIDDLMIPDYKTDDLVVAPRENVQEKTSQKPDVKPKQTETIKTSDVKTAKKTSEKSESKPVRAPVREITVVAGDTLYSLSRKYSVPVNDLAVMNKIGAPFALSVGQKLRVPDIANVSQNVSARAAVEPDKKQVDVIKNTKSTNAPGQKTVATKSVPGADSKKTVAQKAEVKKTTSVPKVEPKKTDAKKAEVKKSDVKQVNAKKADTKTVTKTDVAKKTNTTNKTSDAKNTTAKKSGNGGGTQKMVARSSSRFSWPVRGKILSGYGAKSNGLFNDGINVKAARGTPVLAAENGLVAYAGNEVKGMGNLVIIQHSDGWMTVYAHMDSMAVRRGAAVRVGQKIGAVGQTGKVDAPQLHFEIRKGTRAYNPVSYLKK